ncbi:MAG: radical SAM family heme chaperone HemW [Gemmatimonadetes bacterium]|nr:radical SAM family heme chaperone HemW [Gemmatimonadota bacterium]
MRHIYVHVPFCARRCSYCDFAIAVRKVVPADRYVAAVTRELETRKQNGEWDSEPLETLYFGGGTPSLLPPGHLADLIATITRSAHPLIRPSAEITFEANPDDVTPEAARIWVAAGVNRVSLGSQSFDPAVLAWMHRTHDAEAVPRAVQVLRDAGIPSLSLDFIFGLPTELNASFERDLEKAVALGPDHLSIYGLSVEARTPLARWISRGATTALSDERYADEFLLAHDRLTAFGYRHYEVSNYALPGRESRHNSAYWLERDYAGLGPAAHSMRRGVRSWNFAQWTAYERAAKGGSDPTEAREKLSERERRLERLYLGLRTDRGVAKAPWWTIERSREDLWTREGWLETTGDQYRLTARGWLRLDDLVASLTTSADGG